MNFKLSRKYQINGKFIEKYNQKYTFRKVEDFKKSRDFINIHPIELKNGITTIINQAELISKNDLQNILRDYSGYQSSSINMKKLINKAIEENSKSDDSNETKYQNLVDRHESLSLKLNRLTKEKTDKENKATKLKSFLSVMNKSEDKLNDWNEDVWMLMVENGIINRDKTIIFKFNGI